MTDDIEFKVRTVRDSMKEFEFADDGDREWTRDLLVNAEIGYTAQILDRLAELVEEYGDDKLVEGFDYLCFRVVPMRFKLEFDIEYQHSFGPKGGARSAKSRKAKSQDNLVRAARAYAELESETARRVTREMIENRVRQSDPDFKLPDSATLKKIKAKAMGRGLIAQSEG